MKILSNADLNLNQLKNAVLDNVDADPSSGVIGQVIYNITENVIKYYDGEQWIVIGTGQDGYSPQIVYSTHTWTFSNLTSVDNEISLICQGSTLSSMPFYKKAALVINSEYLTDNTETITWELNGTTGEDYFNKSKPFVIIDGSEDEDTNSTAVNICCSTKVEGDALLVDISDITNPDADIEFFKIAFTEKNADGSYSINITSDLRGSAGKDGADGVSPTVDITKEETTTTITITDVNGEHTSTIEDGYSPQITVLNNLMSWATDDDLNIYFYIEDDNQYSIDVTDISSIELICWWYYEDTCIINWETDVSSGSFHPESSGTHTIIDTSNASWFKATSNTAATGQITYKDSNLQEYNLEISYKDESTGEIVSIITDNLKGSDGESAYQVWLDLGNTGTEQDFIDSLKGTANITGGETDYGTISVDGDSGEITLSSAPFYNKNNNIASASSRGNNVISGNGNSLIMLSGSSGSVEVDGYSGIVLGRITESGYLESSNYGGILSGYSNYSGLISTTGTSCMALGRACSGTIESSGVGSVAIGTSWNNSRNYVLSTGSGSIAAGRVNTSNTNGSDDDIHAEILSSGSGSIAIGDISTRGIISSTGNGSISGGCIKSSATISNLHYIQATGNASIAMGNFYPDSDGGGEITVSGNASMALGQVTAANVNMSIDGSGSLVVGSIDQSGDINVSGNGSACFIGGNYSVAPNISVTGDGSLVVGNGNIVSSGDGSLVLCSGGNATASGRNSICICESGYVKSTGTGSIAIGQGSNLESSGTGSILIAYKEGYATGACSFAMGITPEAYADYSFAFGDSVKVTSLHQVAFGVYNDPQDDLLFMIGNGTTDNARKNLFAIRDDGALVINDTAVDITKLSSTETIDTGWEDINYVALDELVVPTRARRRITNNMVHFNIEIRSDTFSDIENLCNIITNQVIRSDYDNYGIFNTSIVKLEYDSDDQYASILYDQHISGNMRINWETRDFADGTAEDKYKYNFSYVIPVDLYHNMVCFAHIDSFASQLLLSAAYDNDYAGGLYIFSDLIIDIDIQGMLT